MSKSDSHKGFDAVAVIGMACRFPGARNVSEFWHNLSEGIETISFFSDAELQISGVKPEVYNDPAYIRAKGVLEDVEMFDAAFFGLTPREAEIMDPQQRLFLECAWEALENAGYDFAEKSGRIGVYGGSGLSTYFLFNLLSNPNLLQTVSGLQLRMFNDKDFLTTLISYKLNLQGPSLAVQTACSTSLVATHLASQALLDGECDMALAGGVAVSFPHKAGHIFREGEIWSADGHCRAFDIGAQGTVEGNGAGILVLKRFDDARRDRDFIHAVILGSAVNNDGSLKAGYTAPSVESQAQVILEALVMAGVDAESIGYVEAHGSATPLGDPIEVRALTKAFRQGTGKKEFCALGSVKTNFGHLDNAAGSASLIKAIETLKHKVIPPTLHFREPSPQMDLPGSPFYVNTSPIEWQSETGPRRAGVSSLGIGGTNVHLVLEEAPETSSHPANRSFHLLLLSARTESALDAAHENLAAYLKQHSEFDIADVAHTLQVGRRAFRHRRIVVCASRTDAVQALENRDSHRLLNASPRASASRVVMMFPGLGDHYPEMALDLYREEPVFRQQVDRCAEILTPLLNLDLREVLYPHGTELKRPRSTSSFAERRLDLRRMLAAETPPEDSADRRMIETAYAQPAVFTVEYALASLMAHWGICPAAMIGYSLGEYVAACLAGVFSVEDALFLVANRARLIQELPAGTMLAVPLPEEEVRPLLGASLSLAASDSPALSVIAGEPEAVGILEDLLATRGVASRRLQTSHAFHSQMMDPVVDCFRSYATMIQLKPPQVAFISNVTGGWITAAEATDPDYWAKHLRQTVRFADGARELLREPGSVALEMGPGQALSTLVRQNSARDSKDVVLSTMRDRREEISDTAKLLTTLGQLWLSGVKVSWPDFHRHEQRARVPLPTYPFERRRYWIEPGNLSPPRDRTLHDPAEKNPDLGDWFYSPFWKSSRSATPPDVGTILLNPARWLIFMDDAGLGSRLKERLRKFGAEVLTVAAGQHFEQGDTDFRINPAERADYDRLIKTLKQRELLPTHIAHLWTLTPELPADTDLKAFDRLQQMGFYSLVFLAQALGEHDLSAPLRIAIVSNDLYNITGAESCCPHKATLWGPCKVISQEHANIDCRMVDLVLSGAGAGDEVPAATSFDDPAHNDALADCIMAELFTDSSEPVVAYRGGRRWVRGFEPIRLGPRLETSRGFRESGAYLITGANEMGLRLTEHLVQNVKAKVTLIAPPEFPSRDKWELWLGAHDDDDEMSVTIRRLRAIEIENSGGLLTISADLGNESQMKSAINRSLEQFGAINGIIYAASVPGAGIIQMKMREMAAAVLAPKTRGLLILTSLVEHLPLDFFALCSSTVAVAGGLGQVDSCAANAFLDALAEHRAQRDKVTVSIGWSAFEWDKWEIPGMIGSPELLTKWQEQQQLSAISGAEVLQVFDRILADRLPHVVVCPQDLSSVIRQTDMLTLTNFVESMAELRPAGAHPRPQMNVAYLPPQNGIQQTIVSIWQQAFGITQIGVGDNFFDLAGNSLLAIQIVTRLRQTFGVELPMTSLFDAPTVSELADRIQNLQSSQLEPKTLERLLADVEELSAEEAERIFAEELGAAGSDPKSGKPLAVL